MTQEERVERRLVSLSAEEREHLKALTTLAAGQGGGGWLTTAQVADSVADRYEDGITDEEASELWVAAGESTVPARRLRELRETARAKLRTAFSEGTPHD